VRGCTSKPLQAGHQGRHYSVAVECIVILLEDILFLPLFSLIFGCLQLRYLEFAFAARDIRLCTFVRLRWRKRWVSKVTFGDFLSRRRRRRWEKGCFAALRRRRSAFISLRLQRSAFISLLRLRRTKAKQLYDCAEGAREAKLTFLSLRLLAPLFFFAFGERRRREIRLHLLRLLSFGDTKHSTAFGEAAREIRHISRVTFS